MSECVVAFVVREQEWQPVHSLPRKFPAIGVQLRKPAAGTEQLRYHPVQSGAPLALRFGAGIVRVAQISSALSAAEPRKLTQQLEHRVSNADHIPEAKDR